MTIKDKDIMLKATRGKMTNYNGTPIKLPDDFSTETLQARRELHDIFKMMKGQKREEPTIKNTLPCKTLFKI